MEHEIMWQLSKGVRESSKVNGTQHKVREMWIVETDTEGDLHVGHHHSCYTNTH